MPTTQLNPKRIDTSLILDLATAVRRAYAIETSVTQGQERELRVGYREMLEDAIKKLEACGLETS